MPNSQPRRSPSATPASSKGATRPLSHLAFLLIAISVSFYTGFVEGGLTGSAAGSPIPSLGQSIPPVGPIQEASETVVESRFLATAEASSSDSTEGPQLLTSSGNPASGLETAAAFNSQNAVSSSVAAANEETLPDCELSSNQLYCVYTVQPGDILSEIAERFGLVGSEGLSPAELLAESNKPAVAHPDAITSDLRLRVPVQNGIIHTVLVSETLADVAFRYGVTAASIASLEINNISDTDIFLIGQELLIPDPAGVFRRSTKTPTGLGQSDEPAPETDEQTPGQGEADPTSIPEAPEVTPTPPDTEPSGTPTPEPGEGPTSTPTASPTSTAEPTATPATATPEPSPTPTRRGGITCQEYETTAPPADQNQPSAAGFIWPALGPISSCFGPAHPLGIDIDLYAEPNQAVRATAAGIVIFAGGDPCCSYGYYVVIDHGSDFTTLYAHFSEIAVTVGDVVRQGEVIGLAGMTGFASGNHLHFEILYQGDPIEPIPFLP